MRTFLVGAFIFIMYTITPVGGLNIPWYVEIIAVMFLIVGTIFAFFQDLDELFKV